MIELFHYIRNSFLRKAPAERISSREGQPSTPANLRNLFPFFKRHLRQFLVGAGLVLITTALSFPPPLITRYLIDNVILQKRLDQLAVVILLLVSVKGLSMVIGPLQDFYFTRFGQDVLVDLQSDLVDHTLKLPKSFFDEQQTGYLVSRLVSDIQGLRWFFSGTPVYLINNLIRFIGGICFLVYLEWRLALIVLVLLPLMALVVRFFSSRLRILSLNGMENQGRLTQRIQEALSGSSLIKSFSTEEREKGRVTVELNNVRQISLEQVGLNGLASLVIGVLPDIAGAAVMVLGVIWIVQGNWTLGSLLAFQGYMGYVFGPATALANANFQLQTALAALKRVSAIYDILPEEENQGILIEKLKGEIEFRHVSFSYNGTDEVLQDISFKIAAGEQVAIVGPSGVGKTTLISLLLRFYKPTSGEVYVDGLPASDYELKCLRRRLGYVSQNTFLLTGTIGDNLRYGNPDATQEEVEKAATAAGIHDFIESLPEGYGALVGERGVNLSEGQKQRLAIARALIKDPDIIILDEPTSSLDSITEKSIFDALPKIVQNKTVFIVAHRLATAQRAQRILVLNAHRIEAIGTHQELLETCEFYRTLVSSQTNFETA